MLTILYILLLVTEILTASVSRNPEEIDDLLRQERLQTIKNRIFQAVGFSEPPKINKDLLEQTKEKLKFATDSSEMLADRSLTVFSSNQYEIEYHPELKDKLHCVDFPKSSFPEAETIQELRLSAYIENDIASISQWDFILLMKNGHEVKNFDRHVINIGDSGRYELLLPKELAQDFANQSSVSICFTPNGGNATVSYHSGDYKKDMSLLTLYSNGKMSDSQASKEVQEDLNVMEFNVNLTTSGWDFLLDPLIFNAGICPKLCVEERSRSLIVSYSTLTGELGKVRVPNILLEKCRCS